MKAFYSFQKQAFSVYSNRNVSFLRRIDKARNKSLAVSTQNDLKIQTIWSDFAYLSVFDRSSTYSHTPTELDYANPNDDSDTIFQDLSKFKNYRDHPNFSLNPPKIVNSPSEHTLLRVPQEYSLDIETTSSVEIFNPIDTKLLSNFFKLRYLQSNSKSPAKLQVNRLKAEEGFVESEQNVVLNVKSSEVSDFAFVSKEYLAFKGKKLGVAKKGLIKGKLMEMDVRSLFSKNLKIEFGQAFINIGNLNGGASFEGRIGNIQIDSLDESNCEIDVEEGTIELFVKSMKENEVRVRNKKGSVKLYLGLEMPDVVVKHNGNIVYSRGKESLGCTVQVEGEQEPAVEAIDSWEFMKLKIQRKFNKA